jgi:hypothetical protein
MLLGYGSHKSQSVTVLGKLPYTISMWIGCHIGDGCVLRVPMATGPSLDKTYNSEISPGSVKSNIPLTTSGACSVSRSDSLKLSS